MKRVSDRYRNRNQPPPAADRTVMADLIEPRTLKGFRDYLPELMIPRETPAGASRGASTAPTASRPSTRRPWNTPRSCSARAARSRTS